MNHYFGNVCPTGCAIYKFSEVFWWVVFLIKDVNENTGKQQIQLVLAKSNTLEDILLLILTSFSILKLCTIYFHGVAIIIPHLLMRSGSPHVQIHIIQIQDLKCWLKNFIFLDVMLKIFGDIGRQYSFLIVTIRSSYL